MAAKIIACILMFIFATVCAMIFGVTLGGCSSPAADKTPPANKITSPELVRDLASRETDIQPRLFKLGTIIDGLTVENLATEKPKAQAEHGFVVTSFKGLVETTGSLKLGVAADAKHAQALENRIATLTDPERAAIRRWGELGILIGVVILGLYFAAGFMPVAGPIIQKGGKVVLFAGCFAVGVGLALVTLSRFLSQVEWIVAGTFGVGFLLTLAAGAWYLWQHHRDIQSLPDALWKSPAPPQSGSGQQTTNPAAGEAVKPSEVDCPLNVGADANL